MISKRLPVLEKGPEFKSFGFGQQKVKRLTSFKDMCTCVCTQAHCDPTPTLVLSVPLLLLRLT